MKGPITRLGADILDFYCRLNKLKSQRKVLQLFRLYLRIESRTSAQANEPALTRKKILSNQCANRSQINSICGCLLFMCLNLLRLQVNNVSQKSHLKSLAFECVNIWRPSSSFLKNLQNNSKGITKRNH